MEHPIKAYRAWVIKEVEHKWVLGSVGVSYHWEAPAIHAPVKPYDPIVWDKAKREAPYDVQYLDHETWSAGIYALNSWEHAITAMKIYQAPVIGEVDLWGRVVEFTKGYRAEYAMVKQLWIWGDKALCWPPGGFVGTNWQLLSPAILDNVQRDYEELYQCDCLLLKHITPEVNASLCEPKQVPSPYKTDNPSSWFVLRPKKLGDA